VKVMKPKDKLDRYEQDVEANISQQLPIGSLKEEMFILQSVAQEHRKRKSSITIRVSDMDLEAIKLKASKRGLPYQTYINMLLHMDATS